MTDPLVMVASGSSRAITERFKELLSSGLDELMVQLNGIKDMLDSHITLDRNKTIRNANRLVFDGICDMCMSGDGMLCRNGGLLSLVTNGGFAEYIAVPEKSAFKIPDEMQWELAASLPVTILTPYHALKQAA